MQIKRPIGVNLVGGYFIYIVIFSLRELLVRLDYRLYRLILSAAGICDLVIGVLSLFTIIGLMQMRPWGRILAIIVSAVLAVWQGGFYLLSVALGVWTLLPEGLWPNAEIVMKICIKVCVIWYLFRRETRQAFRSIESQSATIPS